LINIFIETDAEAAKMRLNEFKKISAKNASSVNAPLFKRLNPDGTSCAPVDIVMRDLKTTRDALGVCLRKIEELLEIIETDESDDQPEQPALTL
jgi:hypothetical protein